ncbi:MAG: type II secretion system protein, partial [Gammaproteobacteria bacterium]
MTFLNHYSRLAKIKAQRAITLIELLVIIAILGVLSTLASSWYSGYIETARINSAITQISALSLLIDDYTLENGQPPESLADISNSNLIDPWGNPYEYLKLNLDTNDYAKNKVWMMGGGFMSFSMVSLNILSSSGKSEGDRESDKNDRESDRESDKNDRENDRENDKNDRQRDKENKKDSGDNTGDGNAGGGNAGDGNAGGGNAGDGNAGGDNAGDG